MARLVALLITSQGQRVWLSSALLFHCSTQDISSLHCPVHIKLPHASGKQDLATHEPLPSSSSWLPQLGGRAAARNTLDEDVFFTVSGQFTCEELHAAQRGKMLSCQSNTCKEQECNHHQDPLKYFCKGSEVKIT